MDVSYVAVGNTFYPNEEFMASRLREKGYKVTPPLEVVWQDGDIVLYDGVAYRRKDGGWRPTETTTLYSLHGENGLDKPLGDLFLKGDVVLAVRGGSVATGGLWVDNFSDYSNGPDLVRRGDEFVTRFDIEEDLK